MKFNQPIPEDKEFCDKVYNEIKAANKRAMEALIMIVGVKFIIDQARRALKHGNKDEFNRAYDTLDEIVVDQIEKMPAIPPWEHQSLTITDKDGRLL